MANIRRLTQAAMMANVHRNTSSIGKKVCVYVCVGRGDSKVCEVKNRGRGGGGQKNAFSRCRLGGRWLCHPIDLLPSVYD